MDVPRLKLVKWETESPEDILGQTKTLRLMDGDNLLCESRMRVTQIDCRDEVFTITAEG